MDAAKMKVLEDTIADAASKNIASLLHQPKDLNQILQSRKEQIISEKSTMDMMISSMLQSHVGDVKVSLDYLDQSAQEVKQLRANFRAAVGDLEAVNRFRGQFQQLREEQSRHSQLAAAVENAKQIFAITETAERTKKLIEEGKLLAAYQAVCDLERCRDDIMFEFFKHPSTSHHDHITLEKYFQPVDSLSALLGKQVFMNMKRMINTIRKEPAVVVSCLRIIEREERLDEKATERKAASGFIPSTRPKNWKARCFQVLEENVKEKVEGSHITDAKEDKTWLVKHLEIIRLAVLTDLSVVRGAAIPCFPPNYDILNAYAKMYHRNIAKQIFDLLSHEHLEAEDIVTLLTWLEEYAGDTCLAHTMVRLDVADLGGPLLAPEKVTNLMTRYETSTSKNIDHWLLRALNVEKSGWFTDKKPDDSNQYFQTQTPTDVFGIFDQNISIAAKMGEEMARRMYALSLGKLATFSETLRKAFLEFKAEKMKDRSKLMNYTAVMMALINDCSRYVEYVQLWAQKKSSLGHADKVVDCYHSYEKVRRDAIDTLLEEPMHDIGTNIRDLFNQHWLKAPVGEAMGVIAATLQDYSGDYKQNLMPGNYVSTMEIAQLKVLKPYVSAILERHLKFKTMEERKEACVRIKQDAGMLAHLNSDLALTAPAVDVLSSTAKNTERVDLAMSYDALENYAELLVCSEDMIQLELSTFVKKFTDCTAGQMARMLDVRGDMRFDFGDLSKHDGAKILDVMAGETTKRKVRTIFSECGHRK